MFDIDRDPRPVAVEEKVARAMTARLEHERADGDAAAGGSPPPAASQQRTLVRSAAAMASGTMVSRLLGLLRNALLVAVVGVVAVAGHGGSMADAWSVANKLPNIISMLLAGGILNAVLVPQVVRAMRRKDGGEEHVNRLLTGAIVILAGITVVLTAAASLLVGLYAHSFPPEWKALAVALAYWCIPQLFFYGLYTLLGQVLNARSIFGPYMWAPAVNNVIAIAGLVAFLVIFGGLPETGLPPEAWTSDMITLLAGSATLGVVAQALVLVIPLYRSGFRYRPVWGFRGQGLGRASTVAVWAFAALAVGQVGYLAVSNVAAAASAAASETGEVIAGNFAYDNAFLIFMLPQSLVTVSLVTALFTRVSHNAAAREGTKVRDDLSFGLRTLGVFTVFATVAFAVLAIPLVQVVLLDRADFASYQAVGAVLVAMSMGLVSIGVWTMVQRVFYAYEDTRTLFRIQVPMAIILALGSVGAWWLLEPQWWVVGTGAATTISNTVGATVGYLATRKYLPSLDGARVLRTHLRVLLAALPVGLAGWGALHLWGVQTTFLGALLRVAVIGLAMLVGYLLLLRQLRVAELEPLLARLGGPVASLSRGVRARGGAGALRTMSTGDIQAGGDSVTAGSSVGLGAGELLADRYRLERLVSEPSPELSVWQATDIALDAPVRVQLIDGPHRDLTIDAARRAALITDPRLPRVLRAGVESGQGFVVTEQVTGVTLTELLGRGPLPPSQARAVIGEAAAALETARRRGVHHLALAPDAVVRTDHGAVQITGLGTDAASRGVELHDSKAAGRRDAVGLVELLYAALTATWPGDHSLAGGLPEAERDGGVLAPAGDVVENVPNDLDTLCAVTMGAYDDGPFTPGDLVADLAPWGTIDVDASAAPLPPVVRPGESVPVPFVPAALVPTDFGPTADDDGPATAFVDTSGWAPHPLPTISEPTPFADLVSDTGSLPAVGTHTFRHQRITETHVALPAVGAVGAAGAALPAAGIVGAADETAAVADDDDASDETAGVPVIAEAAVEPAATVEPEATVAADATANADETAVAEPEPVPGVGLVPEVEPAVETEVEPAVETDVEPELSPSDPAIAGPLPVLARVGLGWDVPGGPEPELLPEPEIEAEAPSPAMRSGSEHSTAAGAVAVGELGVDEPAPAPPPDPRQSGFTPLRDTNRAINETADKVGGGARRLAGGIGAQVGSVTSRVGGFVEDVRDEFRPVESDEGDRRSRFNPAPIALCAMIALVIFGLVMAMMTLNDASSSFTPGPNPGEVTPTAEETSAAPEPTAEATTPPAEPEGEGEGVPTASGVPITEAVTFDPTVAGGENQGDAYLAFDGNPDTTWNSLRYNSPTYGMKDGIGFTVMLDQTARVSSLTLDVKGEGGLVEIRVGNATAPDQGPVLASGAMGPNVTYTFEEPVEAEAISLWFPELPVASSDGRNRIELAEIRLG